VLYILRQDPFLSARLTLKGGTALNFIYLNLPRLSIDLDFNYTGTLSRETMLSEREQLLNVIETTLSSTYRIRVAPSSYITERFYAHYTNLMERPDRVKIEINFLERLPIVGRRNESMAPLFSEFQEFQSMKVWTYALEELLAMKLKTLLERNYPRDLWDTYQMVQRKLDISLLRRLLVIYVCFIPSDINFLGKLQDRLQEF
jgi:predicted nucleotidyltransferase component of viral defense system